MDTRKNNRSIQSHRRQFQAVFPQLYGVRKVAVYYLHRLPYNLVFASRWRKFLQDRCCNQHHFCNIHVLHTVLPRQMAFQYSHSVTQKIQWLYKPPTKWRIKQRFFESWLKCPFLPFIKPYASNSLPLCWIFEPARITHCVSYCGICPYNCCTKLK